MTIFLFSLILKLNEYGYISLAVISTILFILFFPASIAINAISNSMFQMVNLMSLLRIVLKLDSVFHSYFCSEFECFSGLPNFSGKSSYLFLSIVVLLYLVLLFFREMGYLLYINRRSFDIAVEVSPEIDEAKTNKINEREEEKNYFKSIQA